MKWYDYIAPGHPYINATAGGMISWVLILALIVWAFEFDWAGATRSTKARVTHCPECGRRKHYCEISSCPRSS